MINWQINAAGAEQFDFTAIIDASRLFMAFGRGLLIFRRKSQALQVRATKPDQEQFLWRCNFIFNATFFHIMNKPAC